MIEDLPGALAGEGAPADEDPKRRKVLRDFEAYRRAWREVRFGQLNARSRYRTT